MKRNLLLIVGPPGSGKTTQGRKLSELYGWPCVSGRRLLLDASKQQGQSRSRGLKSLTKDQQASDWCVVEVVPRQLDRLKPVFSRANALVAIYLTAATDDELLNRVSTRHRKRSFTAEAWEKKLDDFEDALAPVLLNLGFNHLLAVDARGCPDDVTERIHVALSGIGLRKLKNVQLCQTVGAHS